jgi:ketosteroid isomerase-like protein
MDDTNDAVQAFRAYSRAFQALDARSVATFFHEPAIAIFPGHGVHALPDAAAVERAYAGVMTGLPAQGYRQTELRQLDTRRLADDLVEVSGTGAWIGEAGQELSRFGMTYLLRRVEGRWRIVVASVHDER